MSSSDRKFRTAENWAAQVSREVNKRIVGRDREERAILASLLSGGHVLIEGPPGVGKTEQVKANTAAIGLNYKRQQFTPDLLPGEIIGYHMANRELVRGTIFTNLFIADEINRASPKTQAALIQAMSEAEVTIDGKTFKLDEDGPFMVLATQNPLDVEGTYPLPENQLDRFLMDIFVYRITDKGLRRQIVRLNLNGSPEIKPVDADIAELINLRSEVYVTDRQIDMVWMLLEQVNAHQDVKEWIRPDEDTDGKAGPGERAHTGMIRLAQALAMMDGKAHVEERHLLEFTYEVMRHRILLKEDKHLYDRGAVEQVITDSLNWLFK